jgi:dTDP-4-amino-4,6-dideoxygalactose transaminase
MIPLVKPFIPNYDELFKELKIVFDSGYLAESQPVYDFEDNLRKLLKLDYVLAVNSGTSALDLALKLLDIREGDEIISTALTAEPTNTSIANTGARIIFADVDYETGLISSESIVERITPNTKAIMIVHYAGMVCDMNSINQVSKKYNIPVIEDAAHAFMSKYNDSYIGKNSRFTIFSFQAIKHMTTIDGGLLTLINQQDYERAKKLRWFGLDKSISRLENDIKESGFKYNMNNINATIGLVQLKYLSENVLKYIKNGKILDKELKGINGLRLIPYYSNTEPSYWLYTIKVERRNEFIQMMQKEGFVASPVHLRNDRHSIFKSNITLPALDKFYEEFVHIPCGWWLTETDLYRMINCIKKGW